MLSNEENQEKAKLSKAESARINGSKSKGATTPEGKLRAAKGNFKHGAYSTRVVMEDENLEAFQNLFNFYLDLFLPQDIFEFECVTNLANTRWRMRRIEAAETANLNAAVIINKPYVAAKFDKVDVPTERALAMECEGAHLERMTRVEERLQRLYERNYKLLCNYRRKSGRLMPQMAGLASGDVPSAEPEPDAAPAPPPESSNLTDPPNPPSDSVPAAAGIVSKIALFLVIFAMLLVFPHRTAAKSGNSAPVHAERTLKTSQKR